MVRWGLAFASVSLVSVFAGMSLSMISPFRNDGHDDGTSFMDFVSRGFQYGMGRPVNLLVMGVDEVLDAPPGSPEVFSGRTDTMLLTRFNPENGTITVLSIPRDSRVEIPGYGIDKVNAANVYGGPHLAVKTVSRTLNYVPVDRYIRINTGAFRALVDLVDGVEVNVPKRMYYTDYTQGLFIDLQPGLQTLNGEQAEGFVRFRYDEMGDIGRAQRQQVLIKALQKKLSQPVMLTRLPQLYKVLQEYVDTDLTFGEIMAIGQFALRLEPDQLRMILLPGEFSGDEYEASYWLLDEVAVDRVVDSHFFDRSTITEISNQSWLGGAHNLRIAVQNASSDPYAAEDMVDFLHHHGYDNAYVDRDWHRIETNTKIVAQQGDLSAAQVLHSTLGKGRVLADSTGNIGSDLTIRVGTDWDVYIH